MEFYGIELRGPDFQMRWHFVFIRVSDFGELSRAERRGHVSVRLGSDFGEPGTRL
jgi:hypothetical protein